MSDDTARERRSHEGGDGAHTTDGGGGDDTGDSWTETRSVLRRRLLQVAGVGALVAGPADRVTGHTRPTARRASDDATPTGRGVRSLATDGDTVVVVTGSRLDRPATRSPLASVLTRTVSGYRRVAAFDPPEGVASFGTSAAVAGETALVGAPGGARSETRAGSVAVLARDGGEWARTTVLRPDSPTGVDRFGAAVALAGETALVGVPTDTNAAGSRVGSVAVFRRAGRGWRRVGRLLPRGTDRFGRAVAVAGETAVVGARQADSTPDHAGVVAVFRRRGSGWRPVRRLRPPAASRADRDDRFGAAVAAAEDTVVVGAPTETHDEGHNAGAVYVFDARGRSRLTAPDAGSDDRFGTAVATDGERVVVGADRAAGEQSGSVTVFERRGGRWRHVESSRPASGVAVAADGPAAVAGGSPGTGDGPGVFEL